MRKLRVQAVARFARFAVTDSVRENDKKFRYVQWLIFSKQFARELGSNKLGAAAGRAVHDENGIARLALGVLVNLAERSIMNSQFRQCFAGCEPEISDRVIAFSRWRIIGRYNRSRSSQQQGSRANSNQRFHI